MKDKEARFDIKNIYLDMNALREDLNHETQRRMQIETEMGRIEKDIAELLRRTERIQEALQTKLGVEVH